MKALLASALIAALATAVAQAQQLPCMQYQYGSCGHVYDSQGNYRGELSGNPYAPNSISNPYGRYGSPYSQDSLNNPYGAGNPYRIQPPRIQTFGGYR